MLQSSAMGKKRSLIFSQGKLAEDDQSWDVNFWLNLTPTQRLNEAKALAYNYHAMHEKGAFTIKMDKTNVIFGELPWKESR